MLCSTMSQCLCLCSLIQQVFGEFLCTRHSYTWRGRAWNKIGTCFHAVYILVSPPNKTSSPSSQLLFSNIQKSMQNNFGDLNQLHEKFQFVSNFFNRINFDKVEVSCIYLFPVLIPFLSLEVIYLINLVIYIPMYVFYTLITCVYVSEQA